jgi:hypothetical protein
LDVRNILAGQIVSAAGDALRAEITFSYNHTKDDGF